MDTLYEDMTDGRRLAFQRSGASGCGFVWCGGFRSDMTGAKAEAIAELAAETGRPVLRFDYSGHGQSSGRFEDGTVSRWLEEALLLVRRHTRGPQILIGSSMGAWIAALVLRALGADQARIRGLLLVAPAHDFTEELMWQRFSRAAQDAIMTEGVWHRPSAYGEPYPITRGLIEDGRQHLLLGTPYPVAIPVRILHGDADADVPLAHAMRVFDGISGSDVTLTLVKGGDHRLSRPADLERLKGLALELAGRVPQALPGSSDRADGSRARS